MIRRTGPALLLTLFLISAATGQDEDKKFMSGPQKGEDLPGPCEVFNINGTEYKGRFHCLVCEYGFDPVVMIFTTEPKAGEDAVLTSLVRRLDASIEQNQEARLHAFMVVLSPQFRSSAIDSKAQERADIIKETDARNELLKRLENRATAMKSVILGVTGAEGPKIYKLNPKAELTVVFYKQLKVVENYTYQPGKMTQDDVDSIIDKVEKTLKAAKKRPEKK